MAVPASAAPTSAVPFFDLAAVDATLRARILSRIEQVVAHGAFVNGPAVGQFEEAFAEFCGTKRCIGTSSGLDALRLSLRAVGVGRGDHVVVPANTFIATAEAVLQLGAIPVLVDVGRDDLNIDVEQTAAAIGPRTRAVVPVHLYGQMADMRRLEALGRDRSVTLVEDACQAHGASRDGLTAGAVGAAAAFSFYPAKNLGAMGDAGAVVTNDPAIADVVTALREHGQLTKYHHVVDGYTARLDTIQAAVLSEKLPRLHAWNELRADAAASYTERLTGVGDLDLPPVAPGSRPVWHLYVVRTKDPDGLQQFLAERGVGSGRHYPVPLHLSPALRQLGYRLGAFPVAEDLAARGVSLPLFPGIREDHLEAVVAAVRAYFDGR